MSGRQRRLIRDEDEDEPIQLSQRGAQHKRSGPTIQTKGRMDVDREESQDSSQEEAGGSNTQKITAVRKAADRMGQEEIDRKVNDIVRFALASEYKRIPIKRDDINKKILCEHSKAFKIVFEKAQERLRTVFGLELVELPAKPKKPNPGQKRSTQEARSSITNSYVLQNILPVDVRQGAIENGLIVWGDEEPQMGLIMVILSLIYTNGRVLSQEQLKKYLDRMGVFSDNTLTGSTDIDELLKPLIRLGYLDKQKIETGSAHDDFEYRWGPRAKVEVDEADLRSFIIEIYGDDAPEKFDENIQKAAGKENGM